MIEVELMNALRSIVDTNVVDVREYYNVFTYSKEQRDSILKNKDLLTFREDDKKVWGHGVRYIQEDPSVVDKYSDVTDTNYQIDVVLDCYGEGAEVHLQKIMEVLNNYDDNFYDNGLGILNYGTVQNNTDLENSLYKKRFSLPLTVQFVYRTIGSENYIIKNVEFEIQGEC